MISPIDQDMVKKAKKLANAQQVRFMMLDPEGLPARLCNYMILIIDLLERESGMSFD